MSDHDSSSLSQWLDGDNSRASDLNFPSSMDERAIADELVVHGLLRDMVDDRGDNERRITRTIAAIDAENSPRRRPRRALVAGIAALAASILIAFGVFRPTTVSAAAALERMIQSVSQSIDRAYRLRVVEEYSQRQRPTNLPEELWGVESNQELNGAMLYAGGVDRYVFVRQLKDGRTRTSGCDGRESWAFRADGPVHVSSDVARFRGGLPGQQQSLGFTDLHSHLTSLRKGYEIELFPVSSDTLGIELQRLTGNRKSRDVRGPKRVEIDFELSDGTIHRMLLDGLPRGRGGPKCVEFVLVSQEKVADGFYSHAAHHDGQRQIKQVGPKR